jgi:dipeptidyl aminopeptidase/acylaminoacyl peptidase
MSTSHAGFSRLRLHLYLFSLFLLSLLTALSDPTLQAQSTSATAQPDSRILTVVSTLEKTRSITQTALSPDGREIAWVLAQSGGFVLDVAPTDNPAHFQRVTAGSGSVCDEAHPAWSPDSEQLAFTSDCGSGSQADIYLETFAGTAPASPRRLTHLHGEIESLHFSPDGKQIGFLYVEGATRHVGALDAMKPPSGIIGIDGLEIQRFAAVDRTSGETRLISPATLHVYEYDWAPDSSEAAYIAAPPPGENNWWVAQLYTQKTTESSPQSILDPGTTSSSLHGLQIAVPRWSPDGSQIAFIGGLMSDQGSTGGDIYLVPAKGGETQNLTPNRKSTPVWFYWLTHGRTGATSPESELAVTENKDGLMRRVILNLRGEEVPGGILDFAGKVTEGTLEGALSVSKDQDTFAYIESSFVSPPEVKLTRESHHQPETTVVTRVNRAIQPDWGKAESIDWTSDAYHVQGWLLYPSNYDPTKKYPLIVSVHGGPSSAVVPSWPNLGYNAIAFSSLGYFVLMPNPRGSFGDGEAFTLANRKDLGYGDLRDILAGIDRVSTKVPIDKDRIGITGWSYGGFMTMFAVTQTQRFHAAVAGAGISNWQSYYGQNSIDQWMIPFFGSSVYDNPEIYAKSSAINYIKNVKTPTLVVVGDRDGECPAPQSFEFWHALRAEHVPARLIVYPNEGHRFSLPDHRRDVLERALSWFEQHLPADGQPLQQAGK